jgi:hypothetical protein
VQRALLQMRSRHRCDLPRLRWGYGGNYLRGPESSFASCVSFTSCWPSSSFFGRRSRRRSESRDESESDPDPDGLRLPPIALLHFA